MLTWFFNDTYRVDQKILRSVDVARKYLRATMNPSNIFTIKYWIVRSFVYNKDRLVCFGTPYVKGPVGNLCNRGPPRS